MKNLYYLIALPLLCSCAPVFQKNVSSDIQSDIDKVSELVKPQADKPNVYRKIDAQEETLFGEAVFDNDPNRLPDELSELIQYAQGADQSLAAAVPYLSRAIGLPVKITVDAILKAAENLNHNLHSNEEEAGFAFSASGQASDVLDQITARTGTSWKWTGKFISIYYLDTQTFDIELIPSDISDLGVITNATSAGASSSGSSSSSGGDSGSTGGGSGENGISTNASNSQTTQVSYQMRFYDDADKQIKALLSKDGSVAVSPSTSTITVRDNANVITAVADWVGAMNERLSRQIEIELTILTITQSDSDSFGVNWNLVRQGVGDYYRVGAISTAGSTLDANSLQTTVVDPNSPWVGSNLLVDALRRTANASVDRRSIVQAMNNQPMRVQTAQQDTFLVNKTTTLVDNVGAQTSFTTMQQTTGLSLTLLPRILDNDMVLLQVQGSISAPLVSKKVDAEDVELELPRTSVDDFLQRAKLKSGSTLVLTGIEQNDLSEDARGIGSSKFWPFGGGKSANKSKRLVVIVLTPRITHL